MKPKKHTSFALAIISVVTLQQSHAGTTWDGGGASTNINLADNWDGTAPGVVNALNGTTAAIFGTGGSAATMNVSATFTALTFNRDSASGFTIDGSSSLSVNGSTSGSSLNLIVNDTLSNGVATLNAPLKIYKEATGTSLLTIKNSETGTSGASLVIAGGISASNPAYVYALRLMGSGNTRIAGPLTDLSAVQQGTIIGSEMGGTVTIAGNQSLGAATVSIAVAGSGTVLSTARIVMGDSTSDIQSWGSTIVAQAATFEVKSTATLTGGVTASVGTIDVSGNLISGGTLVINTGGILRISGSAAFNAISGTSSGGGKIVGGGATSGTLICNNSSGSATIASSVAIGGSGTNENQIALEKKGTNQLTINSASNTYSGGTTLVDGNTAFAIALGANDALGAGPLAIGTAATGANGARLRMAGFSQSVSALSSGGTAARFIENYGAANSTLTIHGATSTTYAGNLRDRNAALAAATGNLGLVKDGSGTLTLSNTGNEYTGATVINGGVLEVANLTNGGIAKTINSTAGSATVTTADTAGITAGMTFVAATLPTGQSVSTVGSGTLTINTSAGIVTGSSTANFGVASSIGLSTNAAANLVLGGGTLRYTGASAASTDRLFTLTQNGGGLDASGASNAAVNFTNTGAVALSGSGARTLALAGNSTGDNTLAAILGDGTGGATSLTKTGAGKWVLSAANTYSGLTTISSGTLQINGAQTGVGTVTVAATGKLGGSGSVIGGINVSGVLAPGNSIESLGGGALSFATGSTYAYELQTLGLNGDLTYSSGTLGIASGTILTLTDLSASTALASGSKLTLISSVGVWNGGFFSYDAGAGLGTLADDSNITLGLNIWKFNYDDTVAGSNFTGDTTDATHFVTMTVVPEPNVAALLGGLGLLTLLRRRR